MEAVICLDKNDITTQWMDNNFAIRLASALNVMITLTPEAAEELISDIAKLKDQRVQQEARRIFNVARRDLGMPELTDEELTEAMSKPVCVWCAGTGKSPDGTRPGECDDCDGTGKPAGL